MCDDRSHGHFIQFLKTSSFKCNKTSLPPVSLINVVNHQVLPVPTGFAKLVRLQKHFLNVFPLFMWLCVIDPVLFIRRHCIQHIVPQPINITAIFIQSCFLQTWRHVLMIMQRKRFLLKNVLIHQERKTDPVRFLYSLTVTRVAFIFKDVWWHDLDSITIASISSCFITSLWVNRFFQFSTVPIVYCFVTSRPRVFLPCNDVFLFYA